jgi:hypothetical protein
MALLKRAPLADPLTIAGELVREATAANTKRAVSGRSRNTATLSAWRHSRSSAQRRAHPQCENNEAHEHAYRHETVATGR